MNVEPDLSDSRAAQILAANPDMWFVEYVRVQFLKDWIKAPFNFGEPVSAR